MGIFKIAGDSIGGTIREQWLESVEPSQMNTTTLMSYGVLKSKDGMRKNNKGAEDVISNGSIIHIPENVFMLLIDGGKIIAATDEPGYYRIDNSRSPSVFFKSENSYAVGQYSNALEQKRSGIISNLIKDSWDRFKFAGGTPVNQKVIYINKQEIPDFRFGTKTPVPFTDRVLVPGRPVACKLTSFGTYTIKIADPILFYSEVCSKMAKRNLEVSDMAEQYLNEFLMAYQTALASLSLMNITVSDIAIKTMELGQQMGEVLDAEWLSKRGFHIQSVGIAGISYDEKTEALLERYANDSILFDPNARVARMTEGIAQGMAGIGSNEGGAMLGIAGMNMGMGMANMMGVMPNQQAAYPQYQQPFQQPQYQQPQPQQQVNQTQQQVDSWTCSCGNVCGGNAKFCFNCGSPKPQAKAMFKCNKCNWTPEDPSNPPRFCPNCGDPFNDLDKIQ